MLLLKTSSDLMRLVTDAAGDIECHVSWMGHDAGAFTPDRDVIPSITTATTTTLLTGPASGQYNVKHLNIRNNHASQTVLVTVFMTDGTDQADLFECTLLAGEALVFTQGGLWVHYDVNGGMYPQVGAVATQAEMEGAASVVTTVSPGRMHFHPGACKCWGKTTVSGGTPTLQVSYNVTSITDTATDQLTVTIATDFSSANYSCNVSIEAATTTLSATTTTLLVFIRFATLAAGSFIIQACEIDIGGATDPASWHWSCYGDQA